MPVVYKNILASALAALIMISSSWMPLHFHFCMGEIAEISIYDTTSECPMEYKATSCHAPVKVQSGDCCDDQTTYLYSQSDLSVTYAKILDFSSFETFIATEFTFLREIYNPDLVYSLLPNPPPLIAASDIILLLQSFLL